MVRFRCLPFLLALASLAASTAAQRGSPLVPLGGPLRTATVRVATGERIPGGGAEESAALAPVFVNTDSSGSFIHARPTRRLISVVSVELGSTSAWTV